jgi:O-acetyl-ADP-ribose deacetylase (regulator of RNase III)
VNDIIRIWKGDIWTLSVDAIVNSTNETLSETQGVSAAITERAGPEFLAEVEKLEGCRTGEAKITHGFALPARNVIFAVGPRYNPKYQTAAENALHSSYRSCLQVLKEHKLSTIAFSPIHSEWRGYPPENGAHIALRTIRRFLEKFSETITAIIFCFDRVSDYDLYMRLLPLYFPRSITEEKSAQALLPIDTGDDNGETIIEERKIRIAPFPGQEEDGEGDDEYEVDAEPVLEKEKQPQTATAMVEEDDGWEGGVSPAILAGMSEDPDEEKRRNLANKSDEEIEREKAEILYARYLRQSREADLSEIARHNLIYPSGVDQQGRPVVVVVGSHFPTKQTPELLSLVLLYVIRVMDNIVNKDYVIVYLHSNMTQEHMPEFAWLRQLHFIFDHKYAKNLRACYVVHPTFWLKAAVVVLSPFLNSNFTDKLRYFSRLQDLLSVVDIQRLNIPSSVFTYDTAENGTTWQPPPAVTHNHKEIGDEDL